MPLALYWGGPLHTNCGFAQDTNRFKQKPRTARKGPDIYGADPNICDGSAGNGGGNTPID